MSRPAPHPGSRAGRVLAELRNYPAGATGAELSRRLELRPQAVNAACRKLKDGGFIARTKEHGLLINRLLPIADVSCAAIGFTASADHPWFWEGNVQARVVDALCARGWTITWQANTATNQQGKDVEAARNGAILWVTVKGFPVGTPKTKPTVQARHWFSHALFDVICWREESLDARIAVAFPDKPRYRNLAAQTTWFQHAAAFHFLRVTEAGVAPEGLDALAITS